MKWIISGQILIYSLSWILVFGILNVSAHLPSDSYEPGDVQIVGIFPTSLQFNSQLNECYNYSLKDIQLAQAMIYAIDELVNKNTSLLPGIKLGWTLIDSCSSPEHVLASLNYHFKLSGILNDINLHYNINGTLLPNGQCNINDSLRPPIIGVVGGKTDAITIPAAFVTGAVKVLQIGYNSYSSAFNNRNLYPYFYHTSPSFIYQIQALIEVIAHFKWNWVTFITAGSVITSDYKQFLAQITKNKGICIGYSTVISTNYTQSQLTKIAKKLKSLTKSQAVMVLGDGKIIIELLREAESQNVTNKTWIGSYTWLAQAHLRRINNRYINGALGINLGTGHQEIQQFRNYLNQLNICNNAANPWFTKSWTIYAKNFADQCKNSGSTGAEDLNFKKFYVYHPTSAFVIDAVMAFAHTLHWKLGCNSTYCKPVRSQDINYDRLQLSDTFKNVQFSGITHHSISFKNQGSSKVSFQIINYQYNDEVRDPRKKLNLVPVGHWSEIQGLTINESKIIWNGGSKPFSRCSNDCKPGYQKIFDSKYNIKFWSCCWDCMQCVPYTISRNWNEYNCTECPPFTISNTNGTQCIDLEIFRIDWKGPFAIIFYIITALAIIQLIFIWGIVIWKRNTPIIKASNFVLMNLLLLWYAVSIPSAGLFLSLDNPSVCLFRLILVNLSQVGISVTIICRSNQVALIFHCGFLQKCSKYLTTTRVQFAIIVLTLIITNGIIVVLTKVQNIGIIKVKLNDYQMDLMCDYNNSPSFLALIAIWLTAVAFSLYFAYRIRLLPSNYNESKFTVLSTVMFTSVDITGIPAFMATTGQTRKVIACITILAYVIIISSCYFWPKIYIILFQPHLNTRERAVASVAQYTFTKSELISTSSLAPETSTDYNLSLSPLPNKKKIVPARITIQLNSTSSAGDSVN